jgi:ABC-type bacteriocin/lantibiotic exporter with double-glycine peptidase domain
MKSKNLIPFALCLAGCSMYAGSARDFDAASLDREPGWLAARDVPLLLQKEEKDCGSAALVMALRYWSVDAGAEEVAAACAMTDKGYTAGELRDFARRKGLKAYLVEGGFADLEKELAKRRPVIVGLVKPYLNGAWTHYEVVVALHRERKIIVTHDPACGWRQNSYEGFETEWAPARCLTLVLFKSE